MSHIPVMVNEALKYLAPRSGGVYVDCTFGAGGYSKAILSHDGVVLYAIDCDPDVEVFFQKVKSTIKNSDNFHFIPGNFAQMEDLLAKRGVKKVDGIVMDLGVSSMQLDQAERGFSFGKESALDMRMSKKGYSAHEFVNQAPEYELARVIYEYGDERNSRKIAKNIVESRKVRTIDTTTQFAEIVRLAFGRVSKRNKIDLATKTFQAIRIFVNDELDNLKTGLLASQNLLNDGGRLVVVSFHSLEDHIVKKFFQDRSKKASNHSRYYAPLETEDGDSGFVASFKDLTKKAVKPSSQELRANVRSRSAKLRAAEKIGGVEYA